MRPAPGPPRFEGDAERFVDGLLAWFQCACAGRYDDVVSQLDHALQCAALAEEEGADDAGIAAALLHDVGHALMGPTSSERDLAHERVGARWLARAFGPEVTEPVAAHVDAKRYLCAVERDYLHGLSDASIESLALQGGPMSDEEVRRFAAQARAGEATALRRRDDDAKVPGREVPGLASHRERLIALVRGARSARDACREPVSRPRRPGPG